MKLVENYLHSKAVLQTICLSTLVINLIIAQFVASHLDTVAIYQTIFLSTMVINHIPVKHMVSRLHENFILLDIVCISTLEINIIVVKFVENDFQRRAVSIDI